MRVDTIFTRGCPTVHQAPQHEAKHPHIRGLVVAQLEALRRAGTPTNEQLIVAGLHHATQNKTHHLERRDQPQ